MIDTSNPKLSTLTLSDLIAGDSPQLPRREIAGLVRWWNIGSASADKINYKDFRINKGEITIGQGNSVFNADSNGIYLGNAVYASAPFRVDMSGNFYAVSAQITGTINATSGVIGGFTITPTQMYGGIIKTSETVEAGGNGVVMDTAGLRGYSATYGKVFDIPTDGSAPTFSSGVINSSIFEINTNSILRTSETVGDGTVNSAGILINESGVYACGANQTLAAANVRILSTGVATFSGSVKGGMTDYMEGAGYFMGLSGGEYKLAVGSPSGNHLSWDNEQLRVKGVIEMDGPFNLEGYATVDLPISPSSPGLALPSAVE